MKDFPWLRIWGRSLLELLLAMPVVLTVHVFLSQDMPLAGLLAVLSAAYVAGAAVLRLVRRASRWLIRAGAAVTAALAAFFMAGISWAAPAYALLLFAALLMGVRGASQAYVASAARSGTYLLRVLFYALASIGYPLIEALRPYQGAVWALGLASLVIVTVQTNLQMLDTRSGSSKLLTRTALKTNGVLLLIYLALVSAVGLTLMYAHADHAVFVTVDRLLPGKEPPGYAAPIPTPAPQEEMDLEAALEMQYLPGWAEQVLGVVGFLLKAMLVVIVLTALVIAAVYSRELPDLLRRKRNELRSRWSEWRNRGKLVYGYRDQERKLREWGLTRWLRRSRSGLAQGRIGKKAAPSWSELQTNAERVRFLYRLWLFRLAGEKSRRHPSMTARELGAAVEELRGLTAPERELIRLYEAARYDGPPPSASEAQELRNHMESKR